MMIHVQGGRIELPERQGRPRAGRERPVRVAVADRRLARGISLALLASLPIWAALAYAVAG